MVEPSPLVSPFCNFLCPPPNSGEEALHCQEVCAAEENCALTPQIAYTIVNSLVKHRSTFLQGVTDTAGTQVAELSLRLAIYTQIPWFVIIFILLIVLYHSSTISGITTFLLLLLALLLIGVVIFIAFYDTAHSLQNMVSDFITNLTINYEIAKSEISPDTIDNIIIDSANSMVPCGVTSVRGVTGVASTSTTISGQQVVTSVSATEGQIFIAGPCTAVVTYTGNPNDGLQKLANYVNDNGGEASLSTQSFVIPPFTINVPGYGTLSFPAMTGVYYITESNQTITFNVTGQLTYDQCTLLQIFLQHIINS